ncbi:uncharacterized protein LOC120779974 [Bactrocera tryoni]|uniref:uncharacterized protein LOC120779974 n=1 Tax=Bactrocera tryoni TaxID=59916 RepID=UPI001A978FE4|nr:uncharacterized protein LOC120779974 [Bactrocera tryoni]
MPPGANNLGDNRFALLSSAQKTKRKKPEQSTLELFPELPITKKDDPKYLVIKSRDASKPITSISCFAIYKEMDVEETRNNPQSVRSASNANAASAAPIAAPRRQQGTSPPSQSSGRPVREAVEEQFEEYVPPRCSLCHRRHVLKRCTIFKAMTPAQRQQIARAPGHCMTCLADTHATLECMSDGSCQYCHRPHHTLFHRFPRRSVQSTHASQRHGQQRHHQHGNQVQRRRAHRSTPSRGARSQTPPHRNHRNQQKATGFSAVVSTLQKLQRLLGN